MVSDQPADPKSLKDHPLPALEPISSEASADMMILDKQTLKDLEIFESTKPGASLFELCNRTRNQKGAQALRTRMQQPWSNPSRIQAVQDSINFIIRHRKAFDSLPSFVTTEIIERYFHGIFPLISSSNMVEFGLGVLEMRFGDTRRYYTIMRGVEATAAMIIALRKIVQLPELSSPDGELGGLIREMRNLLTRPRLSRIPKPKIGNLSAWKALRADQVFRIYEQQTVHRLLQLIYEIDALLAMADTTQKFGFIMPTIEAGELSVQAEGLVHPFVPNMVANPVDLNNERRILFLTGPNMAGKTTYLRASAIALYLAHLGMGVPARTFNFVPAQRIFSSITLTDDIHGGVSFFHAEALRIKELALLLAKGYRVIAFMDEPFKGTNVKDAFDASSAILKRFAEKKGSLFMFSSHLIELCEEINTINQIDCRYFEAEEKGSRLHFEYRLRHGVSNQRLGMRVLEEQGIFELLDRNESYE